MLAATVAVSFNNNVQLLGLTPRAAGTYAVSLRVQRIRLRMQLISRTLDLSHLAAAVRLISPMDCKLGMVQQEQAQRFL